MYNTNIGLMEKVLKISDKKIEIKKRVTTLSDEGYKLNKQDLINCLKQGFEEVFGKTKVKNISRDELNLAKELSKKKYETEEWNHKR